MNLLRTMAGDLVSRAFSPSRWAIIELPAGDLLHGVILGRRLFPYLGVAVLLALQADGSFKPTLIPIESITPSVPEREVRADFVKRHRKNYTQRGHVLVPSPVLPELCVLCGEKELHHQRARVRLAVEQALNTFDVTVAFEEGSAAVKEVQRRQPISARSAAALAVDPASLYYRNLTDYEWSIVRQRLEGVRVKEAS